MSTAQALIQSSLEELGVYAPGQSMNAADAARGLYQFNKFLDYLSNQSLACFCILEQSFTLQVGVTKYTIGTGGMINQIRPLKLIEGPGAAYLTDTNSNNYDVNVVSRDIWNQISNRGTTIVSDIPDTLFYDPQYPLGVINIWPSPTMAYKVYFDSYQQLGNLANLYANLSFPPGYELAIQTNLAVLIGPFFKTALVSQDIKDQAKESKKIIKRLNTRSNQAQFDSELNSNSNSLYNIFSDGYGNTGR